MQKLLINGKKELFGKISISGSKNATLPILAATILSDQVQLTNIPLVKDIFTMVELLKFIGLKINISKKKNLIEIKNINKNIKIFKSKNIKIIEKKINITKFYINIDINKIKKISSESGYIYKNISEAKKNKYKLYPSPQDISKEIKKYGLLKPFVFRKYKIKYYKLISGQARYWAFRLNNKKIKKIRGLLIE